MSRIHHMSITRYPPDGRTYESEDVMSPSWEEVEAAVRGMDDFSQPLVALLPSARDDDQDGLIICGGFGKWALNDIGGDFRYVDDPDGGNHEVQVWRSDQGFSTEAKYVVTDVDRVLRVVRAYYETGTCDGLGEVR